MTDADIANLQISPRLTTAQAAPQPNALLTLADRLRRLKPSHRDPESYFVEKSEIERELRRLAQQQERIVAP